MSDSERCCECDSKVSWDHIIWVEGDKPFCPDCADNTEILFECEYCGQLRLPENLVEYYDDKHKSEWNGKKMCIGCIDNANDEQIID
jgi:hypothetical protein